MFKLLFLAFLLVPLLELYLLIKVGDVLGAGLTVFLVVATAVLGAWLVKMQGLSTMQRAQQTLNQGQAPALQALEGVLLFFSGLLLLIPGFVTDAAGFLLLIPPLRQALLHALLRNSQVIFRQQQFHYRNYRRPPPGDVIEGEVVDEPDDNQRLR